MRILTMVLVAVVAAAGLAAQDSGRATATRPAGVHRRHRARLADAGAGRLRRRQRRPRHLDLGGDLLRSTGVPIGVMRTRDMFTQLRAGRRVAAPEGRRQLGRLRLGAR